MHRETVAISVVVDLDVLAMMCPDTAHHGADLEEAALIQPIDRVRYHWQFVYGRTKLVEDGEEE